MPNTVSAKKYMRVSARKAAQNDRWRSHIDTLRRRFRKAAVTKNATDVQTLYRDLQKTLDAAAQRHVIHRNTAARTKSRLASAVKKNSEESGERRK